jgi:hypothetical protein
MSSSTTFKIIIIIIIVTVLHSQRTKCVEIAGHGYDDSKWINVWPCAELACGQTSE